MSRPMVEDRGETLLEILIAVVILGIVAVAVLAGLMAGVRVSDSHRKQATSGTYARDYTESISRYVAAGNYAACAGQSGQPTYSSAVSSLTVPPGYQSPVVSYSYWNPSWTPGTTTTPWVSTCTVANDRGVQQITVTVASTDGRATERSVVVVRKP